MSICTRVIAPAATIALAATLAVSAAAATSVAYAEEQAGGTAIAELQGTHVMADSGRYSIANTSLNIGETSVTTTDSLLLSDGHYMTVNLRVDFPSNNYTYVYQGSASAAPAPLDSEGNLNNRVIKGGLSQKRTSQGYNMQYCGISLAGLGEEVTLAFYNTSTGAWEDATLTVKEENLTICPTAWTRLAGATALGTMSEIVEEGWDKSEYVVVASIDGYWDALAASALAGYWQAPILLTNSSVLSDETKAEIARLKATKAYIVGGTEAVSDNVMDSIRGIGLDVKRLWGDTAIDTAAEVSDEVNSWNHGKTCVLCTVNGFYDALSVAPIAYAQKYPVYLTQTDSLDIDTYADIVNNYTTVYVIGGFSAVSQNVINQILDAGVDVTQIAGENAWQTSELVAGWGVHSYGLSANNVGVADGNGYWDALTGAALCGINRSVLVLVPHDGTTSEGDTFAYNPYTIDNFIIPNKVDIFNGYVFGGTSAVPASTLSYIKTSTY